MKMMKKLTALGLVLVMIIVGLTSCSSDSQLIGRWENVTDEVFRGGTLVSEVSELEFFSDGTVIVTFDRQRSAGQWVADDDRLYISQTSAAGTYTFSVSRDSLAFTNVLPQPIRFRRIR